MHDPIRTSFTIILYDEKHFESIFIIAINIRFDLPTRKVTCGQGYCALFMSCGSFITIEDIVRLSFIDQLFVERFMFNNAIDNRPCEGWKSSRTGEPMGSIRGLFCSLHHNIKFHTEHHLISSLDLFFFSPFMIIFFYYISFFPPLPQLASSEIIASEQDEPKANIKVRRKVLCDANNNGN